MDEVLEEGSLLSTSQRVWRNAVSSPSWVRDRTPAAKRVSCFLEAPDGLSLNLLGAKFAGGHGPPWLPLNKNYL